MPSPAPESLTNELHLLVSHLDNRESLGDIQKYNIRKKLESCLKSSPADACCGLAFLAAIDGDEAAMRANFKKALENAPADPGYEFNFGLVLLLTNHPDEAIRAFMQSLNHGLCDPRLLNDLAEHALVLDDAELQLKVLDQANKLQCDGPGILRLAALICCANSDVPDEQANMLALAYSDDDLRNDSVLISDEQWNTFQKLADDLRRYL